MNNAHFLKHVFLKKNKKGRLREFKLGDSPKQSKPRFATIYCKHCGSIITFHGPVDVVSGTCSPCLERERIVTRS